MGGIFIPSVRVISVEDVAAAFVADAKAAGARFELGREIMSISVDESCHRIETSGGEIKARTLINAAGLGAHQVSVMAGGPDYPIEFIRGDYYELLGGVDRWGIRTLVYPAMPPHSKSKGIHFGPRTDGRLFLGPSATPLEQQAPKQLFLDAARKFLPEIRETDLSWAYSGVRPKRATNTDKSDFTIQLDRLSPPLINLIGIDSPGLSASMAIARHVTELLGGI
jgi:glycerol-3-phosphate dehydrogenase